MSIDMHFIFVQSFAYLMSKTYKHFVKNTHGFQRRGLNYNTTHQHRDLKMGLLIDSYVWASGYF